MAGPCRVSPSNPGPIVRLACRGSQDGPCQPFAFPALAFPREPSLRNRPRSMNINELKSKNIRELVADRLRLRSRQRARHGQGRPGRADPPAPGGARRTAVTPPGILDIVDDGFGFMRVRGLMPSPDDIYVSSSQVRRFGLRPGDRVGGVDARAQGRREVLGPAARRVGQRRRPGDRQAPAAFRRAHAHPPDRADQPRDGAQEPLASAWSTWSTRSARASARSSSARRRPARRCCSRTSPTASPRTTRTSC